MRYVAFDTSSLSNLGASALAVSPSEFAAALERHSARPVHAHSTIQAMLDAPDAVRRRFQALGRLGFASCGVLVFHRKVLHDERAGRLSDGVRMQAGDLSELFELVEDADGFADELRRQQAGWSASMSPTPASHAEGLLAWWKALPVHERRGLKPQFGAAQEIPEEMVGPNGVITRHILGVTAPEGYVEVALADPRRHRVNLIGAGLLSLYLLGRLMHGEHTPHFPWLRTDNDDRNDLNIVANAAYCDVFVTDDMLLLGRLRFLASRGCVFFSPMTTAEFLGRAAQPPMPIR